MEKKLYILPTIKSRYIKPSAMICGSGDNNETLSSGGSTQPTQYSDGNYYGESKSSWGDIW